MYYWTTQPIAEQQRLRILERSKTLTEMKNKLIRQYRAFGHKTSWAGWDNGVYVYKRKRFGRHYVGGHFFSHHATYKVDTDNETFTKLRGRND